MLQWSHDSKFACQSGSSCTIHFLQQLFWWPTLVKDATEYVGACSVCAQKKRGKRARSGLLQPLPTPNCTCSNISVDIVTGLPPAEGNTVILTIINRFLKAAHFIPLAKLLSALETAQLMVQHFFHLHGIPSDIVSDRTPQVVFQIWKFCKGMWVTYPQSNRWTEWMS